MSDELKRKKATRLPVGLLVILFLVISFAVLSKYLNRGSLDEQLAREKKRNVQLKKKALTVRIQEKEKKLYRLEDEVIKSLPRLLTEQDQLKLDIDRLLKEKNLNYDDTMAEIEKNRELYEQKLKESLKEQKEKTESKMSGKFREPVYSDKAVMLEKLKKENRELFFTAMEEAVFITIKIKREKRLREIEEDISGIVNRGFDSDKLEREVEEQRFIVEVLKSMPAGEKKKAELVLPDEGIDE